MAMQAGAKDEASAAMMADQISKMQALCATMTSSMNITATSTETVPKIETPIITEPSVEEPTPEDSNVVIEDLDDLPDLVAGDPVEQVQEDQDESMK